MTLNVIIFDSFLVLEEMIIFSILIVIEKYTYDFCGDLYQHVLARTSPPHHMPFKMFQNTILNSTLIFGLIMQALSEHFMNALLAHIMENNNISY